MIVLLKRLRPGSRVRDEFLGPGTVVEELALRGAFMVRFDQAPPFDYNTGFNPCLRFADTLEELEQ
jgi:hypothetical protein